MNFWSKKIRLKVSLNQYRRCAMYFYCNNFKSFLNLKGRNLAIFKSNKCFSCANRQIEMRYYENPSDIICLVNELENRDLETCPHYEKYVTSIQRSYCPNCGAPSKRIKHHKREGEMVCHACGFIVDEKTWGQLGKGTRSSGY
jgi:predicted RNA-binding Zn-ribbon protein involved in translation (DUF1610 family)